MAREMKDSGIDWVGHIPKNWNVMANKYVMHKTKEIVPIYCGEDILSLTINGVIVRDLDAGGKMPSSFDGYQRLKPGNLLMCLFDYDVTPRCIGLIKDNGITSPAYSQFIVDKGNHAAYYYYYYLMIDHSKALLHMAKNLRHSFTEEQLGMIYTPVPPVEEQHRIASFLDSKCAEIDKAIGATKASIEEYRKLRQAIITEAVTKGLDPDVEMKDKGIEWIGEIPTNWQIRKMNDVAKVITDFVASGSFGDIAKNVKYLDDPDYAMLIRTADVSNKSGTVKPVYVDKHSYNFLSNSNLFGGEILLPNVGAIGDVYIVPTLYKYMTLAPNSVIVRTKFCDKFFYYYFSSDLGKSQINNITSKTAMPKFNKTDFRQIKVLLPSLEEQHRIASFLDTKCSEIDSLIKSKEKLIEELTAYRKSLIYEYVTGKKEVPIESA